MGIGYAGHDDISRRAEAVKRAVEPVYAVLCAGAGKAVEASATKLKVRSRRYIQIEDRSAFCAFVPASTEMLSGLTDTSKLALSSAGWNPGCA